MKKIWIDQDEWYPVYSMDDSYRALSDKREISDKDYKFVVKAFDNFDKAQEMLQGLVNRTLEE